MGNVVFFVPCLRGGGSERVLSNLSNWLVDHGHDVKFCMTKGSEKAYFLDDRIEVIVNVKNSTPLGQILFIRDQLLFNKDSHFVSFFTFQSLYTLIASIGLRVKIIVSERNDPSQTIGKSNSLKILRELLYRRVKLVVFQTEDARQYFSKEVRKKSIIIENPLKVNLPQPYSGVRTNRIVAVSRLCDQKDIPTMIMAFSMFLESHPSFFLDIYGNGDTESKDDYMGELLKLIKSLNIVDRVRFRGFREDVLNEIRDATAFVNTSIYEGVSNSMIEALAIGLPCICTDCPVGGARKYILSGENGFLVSVGNYKEIARFLGLIADKVSLQEELGRNSTKIRDALSADKIYKEWEYSIFIK